jgi:hypothetical protein
LLLDKESLQDANSWQRVCKINQHHKFIFSNAYAAMDNKQKEKETEGICGPQLIKAVPNLKNTVVNGK